MEQQELEDGPPPGWDDKCQLNEQAEQLVAPPPPPPPPISAIPTDVKMEDEQQDARNEDGSKPQSQAHLSPAPELVQSDLNIEQQESEDEGPPPGWDNKCQPNEQAEELAARSPPPRPTISAIPTDVKMEDEHQDARNEDGSEPQSLAHLSPAPEPVQPDIKAEPQDSEDEGPPPGWDSKCPPEPELPTEHPTTTSSDSKVEDEQQDEEGPPPGWGSAPQPQSQAHSSLPPPMVPSSARNGAEEKNIEVEGERPRPPSRPQPIPPPKPQILTPKPPTPTNDPEMGQMVCGACRRLLSYPRGARYVECACCLEENYVLEEHEVGQVVCGGCNVLLMYPYGAPKVRCANCSTETEIGDHNRRPPLSEQQKRARHHVKRVQTS